MQAPADITLRNLTGEAVRRHLDDVAALRIAVFREWPYLYDGDMAYERAYLSTYLASARSVFVLAFDGARVVGASTGIPLADETEAFRRPFDDGGIDSGEVFYFGESVLLPEYRGRRIGHGFFDGRERHARQLGGFSLTAFAAVDRDDDDPRRPAAHRGNEAFWSGRGYRRQPHLRMRLPWEEAGVGAADHTLTFWTRPLGRPE